MAEGEIKTPATEQPDSLSAKDTTQDTAESTGRKKFSFSSLKDLISRNKKPVQEAPQDDLSKEKKRPRVKRRYAAASAAILAALPLGTGCGVLNPGGAAESNPHVTVLNMDEAKDIPDAVAGGAQPLLRVSKPGVEGYNAGVFVKGKEGKVFGLSVVPGKDRNERLVVVGGKGSETVKAQPIPIDPGSSDLSTDPTVINFTMQQAESQYTKPRELAETNDWHSGEPVYVNYLGADKSQQVTGALIVGQAADGNLIVVTPGEQNPVKSDSPIQVKGDPGAAVMNNKGLVMGLVKSATEVSLLNLQKALHLRIHTSDPALQQEPSGAADPYYTVELVQPVSKATLQSPTH